MPFTLGFDTSNYTTSAAVYDVGSSRPRNCGRLLNVAPGGRGLRQSDAVFAHVKNLPEVLRELDVQQYGVPAAIGVSVRPRDAAGSYMPCFLCGAVAAQAAAAASGAAVYEFSHQAGHIAAAAYSSGCPELLQREFLAWHLSGGTSELVRVTPDAETVVRCERMGGTSDLAAGQVIDRAGVLMHLDFPCGRALDKLSLSASGMLKPAKLSVNGAEMSLSGLENKVIDLIAAETDSACVARFVLDTLLSSVSRVTAEAQKRYPGIPLLCAGGVMSNTLLRHGMEQRFGALFAEPEYSRDNAAGAAILASIRLREGPNV